MASNQEVIQKLCTIHTEVKHTNEKVDDIDNRFEKVDVMLRGNGKTIGLLAKVANTENEIKNTNSVCDKLKKNIKNSEKKILWITIAVVIFIYGGSEAVIAFLKKIVLIP